MIGRIALLSLAGACLGLATSGCVNRSLAASPPADSSRKVELTVYKDDFAMVREERPVKLDAGNNRLQIANVSNKLDPSSVLFTWQNPGSADVSSNTYDLGMPNGRSLLKRYVGQEVELVRYGQDGKKGEKLTGTLEVASDNSLVLKSDGKYIVDPEGTVIAPNRPDIVAMSQLSVGVDSRSKQSTNLGVAYLTGGLGWNADYVANLDPAGDTLSLECWATVTNHTGIAFPESKITLVAGSPNRAVTVALNDAMLAQESSGLHREPRRAFAGSIGRSEDAHGLNSDMPPATSGELYAYPIQLPATIAPEEMNRVRMLASTHVPVHKDYAVRIDPSSSYGGRPARQNATLTLDFTNSEQSKLGLPLPQGTVRAYEPDAAGSAQYIGAADIRDTPKDQLVSLTLSNVFDVTTSTKLVHAKRLDKRHTQEDYQVTCSNEKKVPVKLRVVQAFYGGFSVLKESEKSKRLNNGEAQWTVTIPPAGHTVLTYSVRVGG
ncbi:MAG TPA: DUF4139 domain-containing protein [Fimbriimonadaceae bacterium]|nr:DUF4139 domain-containing protein [Fimbriimonadaceae bacterium]